MDLVNLTSGSLTLFLPGGNGFITLPKSATPARVETYKRQEGTTIELSGKRFPIVRLVSQVLNLPEYDPSKILIVTPDVAWALRGSRDDVVVPDGGVLDSEYEVVGCYGFARV